jgi:hypothetical protein
MCQFRDLKKKMKTCLQCNDTFRGRSDKKFCNDYCRNAYNNQQKKSAPSHQRILHQRLQRNHALLCRYLPEKNVGPICINKNRLTNDGFVWRYCTESRLVNNRNVLYGCYEFRYFSLNERYLILLKENEFDY